MSQAITPVGPEPAHDDWNRLDRAWEAASRFPARDGGGDSFDADIRAWQLGVRDLRAVAMTCPSERWPAMRGTLAAALEDANVGVWLASLNAIAARDRERAVEILLHQMESSADATRVVIAGRYFTRVAHCAPVEIRAAAVERLTQLLRSALDPGTVNSLACAIGSLGPEGTTALLALRDDPRIGPVLDASLPHALAQARDPAALQPLLRLLAERGVSDGRRVACLLALGALLRSAGDGSDVTARCDAVLRLYFERHDAPAVAGAAALALARSGRLVPAPVTVKRLNDLLDSREGRDNALRAICESGMHSAPDLRGPIVRLRGDPTVGPTTKKILDCVAVGAGGRDARAG